MFFPPPFCAFFFFTGLSVMLLLTQTDIKDGQYFMSFCGKDVNVEKIIVLVNAVFLATDLRANVSINVDPKKSETPDHREKQNFAN